MMKMPTKKPGGEDMEAMDALMASSPAPDDDADDAAAALGAGEVAEPRGDPAELVASIQAQLDELSQLLAG